MPTILRLEAKVVSSLRVKPPWVPTLIKVGARELVLRVVKVISPPWSEKVLGSHLVLQ